MVWLRQPGRINAEKHIIGSDMGTGLSKAWKTLGLCSARACHSKDEYTPVCTLKTMDLPKQALKVLTAHKRATVGPRLTKLVGGDQLCETHANTLKKCFRRLGLLGRSARSKGHIDGLAAEFLTRQTGLEAIVQAFACYRHRWFSQKSCSVRRTLCCRGETSRVAEPAFQPPCRPAVELPSLNQQIPPRRNIEVFAFLFRISSKRGRHVEQC